MLFEPPGQRDLYPSFSDFKQAVGLEVLASFCVNGLKKARRRGKIMKDLHQDHPTFKKSGIFFAAIELVTQGDWIWVHPIVLSAF